VIIGGARLTDAAAIQPALLACVAVSLVDPTTVAVVTAGFPQLADVRLTHSWGGAVDRAPGRLPFVGTLCEHDNVHYATGFSGNGVGPSALLGRIVGCRALGLRDACTENTLTDGPPSYLPPEAARTLGGLVVRDAVRRAEGAEERGQRAGVVSGRLRTLVWFTTPQVVEPRLKGRPADVSRRGRDGPSTRGRRRRALRHGGR
jgi:hypothetical protein